jgi:predicted nucleic acid-binding protein
MNHAVAVDASVAVKWVVDEPHTDRAMKLWADNIASHRPVISAPHFPGEVTNAIYQRTRTTDPAKRLDIPNAEDAVRRFLAFPVALAGPDDLYHIAFAFATAHRLSAIYDAVYVVMAQLVDTELWTADQRLLRDLGTTAPWVRFIGDYPF